MSSVIVSCVGKVYFVRNAMDGLTFVTIHDEDVMVQFKINNGSKDLEYIGKAKDIKDWIIPNDLYLDVENVYCESILPGDICPLGKDLSFLTAIKTDVVSSLPTPRKWKERVSDQYNKLMHLIGWY